MAGGIGELLSVFSREVFTFRCHRPDGVEDFPEFSERVRGAFGAALAACPAWRGASGRLRPHAYGALFSPPALPGAPEPAKPFVIRAGVENAEVVVRLSLFGMGIGWRDEAAAALLEALGAGVALKGGGRMRVSLPVRAVEQRRFGFIEAEGRHYAKLLFRSPVALRRGRVVHADPPSVLLSLATRAEALAAWQGMRLVYSRRLLGDAIAALDITTEDWRQTRWQRHSRNQGDTEIPMDGWLGNLVLRGDVTALAPYLALGAVANTGSHAALGQGWFDLVAL